MVLLKSHKSDMKIAPLYTISVKCGSFFIGALKQAREVHTAGN